jgi:ribonuclease P protein component
MLKKNKRVDKVLFQEIMKNGRVIASPVFLFRYIGGNHSRLAVVTPKSVVRRAVGRNKLRRQGYTALRSLPSLPQVSGIFFYKKTTSLPNYQEIKDSIVNICKKLL